MLLHACEMKCDTMNMLAQGTMQEGMKLLLPERGRTIYNVRAFDKRILNLLFSILKLAVALSPNVILFDKIEDEIFWFSNYEITARHNLDGL